MRIKRTLAAFLCASMCLTACGSQADDGRSQESAALVLAVFDDSEYLQKQVELYNQTHTDHQIEIKKYERSENIEEDGIFLLQREIVSGEGPDLIDFGSNYATSDIVGDYTEDLFPYMDGEYREKYFDNILTAFSYEEKLYALPLGFILKSFVGRKENLGERGSWTVQEMVECFREQGNDKVLYPGAFKKDVFGTILTGSMEHYIDWESGECSFNGEQFRDVMEFCNGFPDHLEITNDFSTKQTFLDDKALLLPVRISSVFDIVRAEYIFDDEEITYIGFPVEGINGTIIESCGPVLAISAGSENKDAAWEFISGCLSQSAQSELPSGFPICRSVLDERITKAMDMEYETDGNNVKKPVVKQRIVFEGEDPVDIYNITQEQGEQLLSIVEQAEISSQTEWKIYNIIMEEAEYYFNGAKSLEETADIIQARVSTYVSERIE